MAESVNDFQIFSDVSQELKQNIKIFHIFDDRKEYNVLFITSDDTVYGFGSNLWGVCGLGHNTTIDTPEIIPELCNKNIKQFFNGITFVLALNCDNQLYGWGNNTGGQLGIGIVNSKDEYLKPLIIEPFNNETIIDISCGDAHTLVLTSTGTVFGFGNNRYGQIGCGKQTSDSISIPIQLKSFTKFTKLVYSFGFNLFCELGHESHENIFEPKLINISNVISVCRSVFNTYFLTNERLIYFCGKYYDENNRRLYQKLPKLLKTETKILSLHSSINYWQKLTNGSAFTEEGVYSLEFNNILKTKYKTIIDFYSNEYQLTHKTIDLIENNLLLENKKYISSEKDSNRKFLELRSLGTGAFGSVVEVRDETNGKLHAIKKVLFDVKPEIEEYTKKELSKEVDILSKCCDKYVVKYYDSWFHKKYFYIQMELCFDNLNNILKQKSECFKREISKPIELIEFFISSQLFKEVLECVQYLHDLRPNPIIHRDLKPHNILVIEKPIDGRFIKLGDFGLATFDNLDHSQYLTVYRGTVGYIAPEVAIKSANRRAKYTTKADIYSLGRILFDSFDLDIDSSIPDDQELSSKWNALQKLGAKMMKFRYESRPTCSQVISEFNLWGIQEFTESQKKSNKYSKGLNEMKEFSNKFFNNYFEEKVKNISEVQIRDRKRIKISVI